MIRGNLINMAKKPEDKAREDIDRMLERAGWDVQDIDHINIQAHQGVARFSLKNRTWFC
jgi:hypothetical protein